jgi:hypothetical protein
LRGNILEIAQMSPQEFIAQYCIVSKLGESGMGEVSRVVDTKLDREVARMGEGADIRIPSREFGPVAGQQAGFRSGAAGVVSQRLAEKVAAQPRRRRRAH